VQAPALALAGVRCTHTPASAAEGIANQWFMFEGLAQPTDRVGSVSYGVAFRPDPASGAFDYMVGVEVSDVDAIPAPLVTLSLPAKRYAVFEHTENVVSVHVSRRAIWNDWLPRSGLVPADLPELERYDERFDPKTGSGGIELWVPIED
jgi:AraC family transcriptional regulator